MTPAALSLARRVRELLPDPGEDGRYPVATAPYWLVLNKLIAATMHTRKELLAALAKACGQPFYAWLRAPGRTHADVLALLDSVIEDGER